MASPDTLRYARLPLTHGSGAIPAVGFGTLIPDPLATKQATKTALEVGFRHSRLEFTQTIDNNDLLALIVATITMTEPSCDRSRDAGSNPFGAASRSSVLGDSSGSQTTGSGPTGSPADIGPDRNPHRCASCERACSASTSSRAIWWGSRCPCCHPGRRSDALVPLRLSVRGIDDPGAPGRWRHDPGGQRPRCAQPHRHGFESHASTPAASPASAAVIRGYRRSGRLDT
jgi:hypothetical protein